jgi:hypothetical protein
MFSERHILFWHQSFQHFTTLTSLGNENAQFKVALIKYITHIPFTLLMNFLCLRIIHNTIYEIFIIVYTVRILYRLICVSRILIYLLIIPLPTSMLANVSIQGIYERMYICMYVCTYVCPYVCIYVRVYAISHCIMLEIFSYIVTHTHTLFSFIAALSTAAVMGLPGRCRLCKR